MRAAHLPKQQSESCSQGNAIPFGTHAHTPALHDRLQHSSGPEQLACDPLHTHPRLFEPPETPQCPWQQSVSIAQVTGSPIPMQAHTPDGSHDVQHELDPAVHAAPGAAQQKEPVSSVV
jgi:hypothetical protein